jgi:predicted PurR-regulated permease PerM
MAGEPIDRARQIRFWLLALLGFLLVLYLLRAMLLPFVAGMAVAYFLDPVCDRLQRLGCSRVWATTIVSICFILALVLAILLILPTLQSQIMSFAQRLPGYLDRLLNTVWPELQKLGARLGIESLADLRSQASGMVGGIVSWAGGALAGLVTSGVALANLLSLLFITPVVAFYLLRDWDRLKRETDSLLPERHAATIRQQLAEVDRTLAGFARGQATVCLVLAAFYGIGLTVIGVDFGLAVGIGIGLISFIPYLGSITGFVVSVGIALAQFDDWLPIGAVVALFACGQFLEGYVLTPRLVGDRVGLHPVWVIFALLAGGTLFGFVGLLLGVPAAAIIGVLIRFAAARYRDSRYYRGDPSWPSSPSS